MQDGPIERLRAHMGDFTKAEAAPARYFLEHPASVVNKTIAEVVRETGFTSTGIIRMCQRIGYSGYAEFRFSMNRELMSRGVDADERASETLSMGLAEAYAAYMRKAAAALDADQLERVARLILSARRISLWGVNRTYESVLQLSHRLFRIGIFNQTTSDGQVMVDISTILGAGDLCIVISLNGRGNRAYGALMSTLVERGVDVVLVTMNPKLKLTRLASEVVVLPWISNDYTGGFLEDQIVVFMYVECLLTQIASILHEG